MTKIKAKNVVNNTIHYFTKQEWEALQKKAKFKALFKLVEAITPPEVTKLMEAKKKQENKKNATKDAEVEK